jgi:hypothetical protein
MHPVEEANRTTDSTRRDKKSSYTDKGYKQCA